MNHARRAVALALVAVLVAAPVATGIAAQSATAAPDDADPVVKFAYVDSSSGNVTLATASGDDIDLGVTADVIGEATDLDGDNYVEVPYVDSNQHLGVIDRTGDGKTNLTNIAKSQDAKLAVGDLDGDGTSAIFYAQQSSTEGNELARAFYNGTTEQVIDKDAESVVGVGDVNDDGTEELIFVGSSNEFHAYNATSDSATPYDFSPATPGAVGAPADFNGDGVPQIPMVDSSGNVVLANSNGVNETLTSGAAKTAVAARNVTGTARPEVLYLTDTSEVHYVTYGGETGTSADTYAAKNPGVARVNDVDEPLAFSNFSVTNESNSLRVAFDATEDLRSVSVNVSGPDGTELPLSDFDEESSGGDYTYVTNYTPTADGTYNVTLESGEAVDGDTASPGLTESATVTRSLDVTDLNATAASGQNLNVSFEATDELDSLTLTVSGPENETFSLDNFSTNDSSAPYTYNGIYRGDNDGNYTVTFDSASSPHGTDDGNLTENVTVDQTGVAVENATLQDATNADGIVNALGSVTVSANVTGDVGSVTADASAFGAGTVALDAGSDGTYRATVAVDANRTSGNETVTARDGQGAVDTDTSDDLLLDAADPTVVLGENRTVDVGESVTFAPDTAHDDASGVADYTWNLGPVVSDNRTTTYAYEDASTYTARLSVTDDAGNTETATLTVNVTENSQQTTTTAPTTETGNTGTDDATTEPTPTTTPATTTPATTTTPSTTTTPTTTDTTTRTTTEPVTTNTTAATTETTTSTSETTTGARTTTKSDLTTADTPGFGVGITVIALLAVTLLARRDD